MRENKQTTGSERSARVGRREAALNRRFEMRSDIATAARQITPTINGEVLKNLQKWAYYRHHWEVAAGVRSMAEIALEHAEAEHPIRPMMEDIVRRIKEASDADIPGEPPMANLLQAKGAFMSLPGSEQIRLMGGWAVGLMHESDQEFAELMDTAYLRSFLHLDGSCNSCVSRVTGVVHSDMDDGLACSVRTLILEGTSQEEAIAVLEKTLELVREKWAEMVRPESGDVWVDEEIEQRPSVSLSGSTACRQENTKAIHGTPAEKRRSKRKRLAEPSLV